MINWIKNALGIAATVPTPQEETKPATVPSKKPVAKRRPSTQKTNVGTAKKQAAKKAASELNAKKQTKATLTKLTKAQIDDLAKTQLSVELDRRKTKDALIKDYLAAQKK